MREGIGCDIYYQGRIFLYYLIERRGAVEAPYAPVAHGLFVPDVLADRYCDPGAVQIHCLEQRPRLEIPVFVEDIICGKQGLIDNCSYLPVLQEESRVMKSLSIDSGIGCWPSHNGGYAFAV